MGCCFSSDSAEPELAGAAVAAQQPVVSPDAVRLEPAPDGATSAVVQCPKAWVSHVVGSGGETIKRIRADSGADIQVGQEGDPVVITITGSPDAVAKAAARIRAVVKEAAAPDYEGEAGKLLRAKADEYAAHMETAAAAKDEAFNNGDKAGGHARLEEVKEWQRKMHEANKQAAAAIFQHRNAGKGDRYMDFHGLRKQEALDLLEERLAVVSSGTLELVPGAGHHSNAGGAVLKPAIIGLLKQKNISFEERNAGTLLATL
mmetsp:Transcript_24223/g.60932  ORF Transcript_24223/g.60932 Transcript_24223/m.60932 type:complete len:260 (+) Transcript_24223:209-988(+)